MGKYTNKMITQRVVKIYANIRVICLLFIFGKRYSGDNLFLLLSQQGIYHRTGFNNKRISTITLFSYRNKEVRRAIWELKFKNNKPLANTLGSLVADVLHEELSNQYFLEHFSQPILCVVPSSRQSFRTRGFNQNILIVRAALSSGLDELCSYEPDLLIKTRNTLPQNKIKERQERLNNVKNSFAVSRYISPRGRNVILFDDVFTTGATLDACTQTLHKAGARSVLRVTIAH